MRSAAAVVSIAAALVCSCSAPGSADALDASADVPTLIPGHTSVVTVTISSDDDLVFPGPYGTAPDADELKMELRGTVRTLEPGPDAALHDVTLINPRTFQFVVDVPEDFGEGPYELLFVTPRGAGNVSFDFAPFPGVTPSPDGTGFCCPTGEGSCDALEAGGWIPPTATRCNVVTDAAPPCTTTTDAHGCEYVSCTGSCISGP